MKRILNEGIRKHHEEMRAKTYKKIRAAARSLIDEGRKINIPNLVQVTGLSNSLFSKAHVRKFLLETHGVGLKSPSAISSNGNTIVREDYNKLLDRIEAQEKRLTRAEITIRRTMAAKEKAELLLREHIHDNEILRGQLDIAINQLQLLEWKKGGVKVNKTNIIDFLRYGPEPKKKNQKEK